jgi:alkylation response protein AidB-like acyl-CoA dehydrogenase
VTALGAEHDGDRIASLAIEVERRFGPFVREWVNPGADGRDRTGEPLPRSLLAEAGRLGLHGFSLPAGIGGAGRDKFEWGIVLEELSRISHDAGLSAVIDVNAGVAEMLVETGRADLIERYALPMAAGAFVCPPAAYEGRDPFEYRTVAREVAGGWRLDGSKPFVGGAVFADAFLVYVREDESGDVLGFVVERRDEGVCVDPLDTTGLRSMGFGTVSLDRVQLPRERLVVGADAVSAFNIYLRNRRLMTACAAVGQLRALLDECVLALRGRRRGGRGVLEYPNVQRTVGEMFTAIHTSRAIVHRALATTMSGERDRFFDPMATVAKEFVAEQAMKVGLAVMNLQGGEGYMRRHPWERRVRDALGLIGGQGAQELLLIQLGQHAALEIEQRQVRMEKARRTIAELTGDASAAFASALASGLLDELRAPVTADEAARRLDAPWPPVEVTLRALAATGLVRRHDGERFAISDGLASILAAGGSRAGGVMDGAPGALADLIAGRLARELDGLDDRLHRAGAQVLDAGGGPARLATELARRLPLAQVVTAGPASGGDLDDAGRFDLAWAGAEHPCLPAVLRTVRLGGWAVLAARSAPDEVARAMEEAGFGSVRIVPEPLYGTPHVVAGRRTR